MATCYAGEVPTQLGCTFSLVCLRQLEEELPIERLGVQSLVLSHDRRLLRLLDGQGRCRCYSCDSTRPAFLLEQTIAEAVKQDVWMHIPSETSVLLHESALREYPGNSCLVALGEDGDTLLFCLFARIETRDAEVVDVEAQVVESSEQLDSTRQLFGWASGAGESPNSVARHKVSLAAAIRLFPDLLIALRGASASVGLRAAKPSSLALVLDDVALILLDFRRNGVFVTRCFLLQRPARLPAYCDLAASDLGPKEAESLLPVAKSSSMAKPSAQPPSVGSIDAEPCSFSAISAQQDWIFAVTPPPRHLLLIWSLTGTAFHALPLGEYVEEGKRFSQLVVALDLADVALIDNHNDVWIVSLNEYFDGSPKGLDWELIKERQRCADGVGVFGQTTAAYQEHSCYPDAFGLQAVLRPKRQRGSRTPKRNNIKKSGPSIMDCLVEGVPTYGISVPAGRGYGMGDTPSGSGVSRGHHSADGAEGAATLGTTALDAGGGLLPWYERITQTQVYTDMDSRWSVLRTEQNREKQRSIAMGGAVDEASTNSYGFTGMLNGFSIPSQHGLGDDDLDYSFFAALRKHARRQLESRLPHWLGRVKLALRAQCIDPPMFGTLHPYSKEDGIDSDSSCEGGAHNDVDDGDQEQSTQIAALRQGLAQAMNAGNTVPGKSVADMRHLPEAPSLRRPPVQVGRVKLSITASDIICEIWKKPYGQTGETVSKSVGVRPWGICFVARMIEKPQAVKDPLPQVDHLTGGLHHSLEAGNGRTDEVGKRSPTRQVTTVRSRDKMLLPLLTQNHVCYLLSKECHLFSLLLRQSPIRIISNLLIFDQRSKASTLCALNGWSSTQLPVLGLFLGLRFRELNDVKSSLNSLKPHQEMEASRMIMAFIKSGYSCAKLEMPSLLDTTPKPMATSTGWLGCEGTSDCSRGGGSSSAGRSAVALRLDVASPGAAGHTAAPIAVAFGTGCSAPIPADRSFVSRLLEVSMRFLIQLVQTRVGQVKASEGACRALTYLQPAHAAEEPQRYAAMVVELAQLTVHMQSIRALQQQLISFMGEEKGSDVGQIVSCPPLESGLEHVRSSAIKQHRTRDAATNLSEPLTVLMRSGDGAEAIVRAALVSGRVSSALIRFHALCQEEGRDCGAGVFAEFRVTAGRLAYQLVCNQQVDFLFIAMHMLRNVGENVNRFFKAVAFHTSKRVVRRRLLLHLKHMKRLSEDEQALISLVGLLERLYTNPCYTTEFNRMTTSSATGRYPQRAHNQIYPPFETWPAGGYRALRVGLSCDGAVGGGVDALASDKGSDQRYEQQASLRELPVAQRMPLELHDLWGGYQNPAMAALLDVSPDARRAWSRLPCGDIDDLEALPSLGLANFHKASNLEGEKDESEEAAGMADFREVEAEDAEGEGEVDDGHHGSGKGHERAPAHAGAKTTCRQCHKQYLQDDLEIDWCQPHSSSCRKAAERSNDALCRVLEVGDSGPNSYIMGYLHVTLGWMEKWSWSTRVRILMEKTHYEPLVEQLTWLQPPPEEGPPDEAWRKCWLDFMVAHQDWRGLASWVRSMPLSTDNCVDSHGTCGVTLKHIEEQGLPFCTSLSREILLQELGRRGVFCHEDTQTFPTLLRRLALCDQLFGEREAITVDKEGLDRLALENLLPIKKVSPFHRFFIHFCIDRDLPTVLLLYLQHYKLAQTMSDLEALQIQYATKPWASLLLVGRLGNAHLFTAALQHAATVAGRSESSDTTTIGHDANDVPFMPLNALATSSPKAFLATLMFAPVVSALEAAKARLDSPWHVDLGLLWQVVKEYPTLCEALFPGAVKKPSARPETQASMSKLSTSLMEAVAQARERQFATAESYGDLDRADEGDDRSALVELQLRDLDDMLTFKRDVSLSQLLSDVAAFDVSQALRPLPLFLERAPSDLGAGEGLSVLVESSERFLDDLGEDYFLAQGRALMAFHVLLTKCAATACPDEQIRFPLALPAEDARRLRKVAKSVALHNLLNEGVVSGAVCFLELCSLETEVLRVDVQAAKRIYEHNARGSGATTEDKDRSRAAAANVIELFMSFPDTEDTPSRAAEAAINSPHLLSALRMLEESTWALDPHPSAPSVSSLQALAYDSPWHLVALFCRVHSLPRSLTLLHELARNNDWVLFLHESDLQQCPADTVLDIVEGYFKDVSLLSHLRILARSIAAQGHKGSRSKAIEDEHARGFESADAIGFLERRRMEENSRVGTGIGLLRHALKHRAARLAVMASAFVDATPLQCMAVWLSVNTAWSQATGNQMSVVSSEAAIGHTSPAEVAAQIARLCRRSHAFSLVLRALKLFDPSNPLMDFVKFHREFVQCRFKSCQMHLRNFVRRRDCESQRTAETKEVYCLEVVPYVVSLSEEMVQYLLDTFHEKRMMLLSVLHQANFSSHYSQLFRSFRLIQQTGLNVDFRQPASELLHLLISKKMFAEAREWAQSSGIVGDTIVFEEVTGMIVEFRQGVWWNVLDERLQLWHQCYCNFTRQNYPPLGAAMFFLDIISKLEQDLLAREQLMLLCIAFELLGSSTSKTVASTTAMVSDSVICGVTSTSDDSASTQAQAGGVGEQSIPPTEEQVGRIKLSILLILIGTSPELAGELDFDPLDLSYDTLRGLARRVPEGVAALPIYSGDVSGLGGGGALALMTAAIRGSDQRFAGPRSELLPYLETAVGALMNCDQMAWAKSLADGFGFKSIDLQLAEALEKVAGGSTKEALIELSLGLRETEISLVDSGDAAILLRKLSAQCSSRVAPFCRRCQVFYAVSRCIGMNYKEVAHVEVSELLVRLLSPRPDEADFALCRSLLSCYPRMLQKARLAQVLADCFLRSTVAQWSDEKLDEFVSLLEAEPGLLGDAALRGIPSFQYAFGSVADATVGASDGLDGGSAQVLFPFECEVEVLVMAYRAYVLACREQSIGELLAFLRVRAHIFADSGKFALLVRLLIAIPEYHAMEYMFGLLVHHGQLDLLLAKGCEGRAGQALPVALVRYLQHHLPRNLELLVKVHRCFGLDTQLADLLNYRAKLLTESIGRKWEQICSEAGEEKLLMSLSMFMQCSRFYMRGKRFQQHLIANEQASLICLQLKAVQIHLAASLQEQQQQAAAAALRKKELAERKALARHQHRRNPDDVSLLASALEPLVLELAGGFDLGGSSAVASAGGLEVALAGVEASSWLSDTVTTEAASSAALDGEEVPTMSLVTSLGEAVTPPTSHRRTESASSTPTARASSCAAGGSAGGGAGAQPPTPSPFARAAVDSLLEREDGASEQRDDEGTTVVAPFGSLLTASELLGSPAKDCAWDSAPSPEVVEEEVIAPGPLGPVGDPFVVINLEAAEVCVFAEYHHDFVAAFVVVSAYKHILMKELPKVWPRALYRQVVLLGNNVYFQHFLHHLPLGEALLVSCVELYSEEECPEQFPLRAMRMKEFLREGAPNLETRYRLSKQLGSEFDDVAQEAASSIYMA